MSGYIKLNRGFFNNFLWNEAREFSKAEAWIDLIQSARFEASTEVVNGKVIELQRGELPVSRRFLELRWNWGSTKVSNFLKMLTQNGMINHRQSNGQTILILVKFNVYNASQTTDKPPTNHEQTTNKPRTNQNKEYKEYKNEKNIIEERKLSFSKELEPFISEYGQDMINDFFEYWTENNKSGTKFKKELQQTWDTERRLKTWCSNEKKFVGYKKTKEKEFNQSGDPNKPALWEKRK